MPKKRTSKKKTRKQKKAVSEMMAVVADEPKVEAAPKVPSKPRKEKPYVGLCDVCLKKKQERSYVDCDEHWELPGHPDHIFRTVCVDCKDDYAARDECAQLVLDAMKEVFEEKEMSSSEISSAITIMWRTFHVAFDHKALIKMARKLKVKHPWLKGKRAK